MTKSPREKFTCDKNGDKLVNKISTIIGKWNSGRFYDLLLRPNIVNTYLFSNIWYYASVIDLKVADVTNMQSISNRYVHSNMPVRQVFSALEVICTIFHIKAQNDSYIFQTLTVILFFHLSQK